MIVPASVRAGDESQQSGGAYCHDDERVHMWKDFQPTRGCDGPNHAAGLAVVTTPRLATTAS